METSKRRNFGLDLLKALCMIAVVGLHSQRNMVTGTINNTFLYYVSRFAMPCFFMINGYLILNRNDFTFTYYKRKIVNMIRVLISGGGIAFVYSLILLKTGIGKAGYNALKCVLGYYVIPFWWIFTFAIIYTILLFSFQQIKMHIRWILISLLVICLAVDALSMIEIFTRNGYFIQALVSQRFRIWTWLMYFCLGYYLGKDAKMKRSVLFGLVVITSVLAVLLQIFLCRDFLGRINSEYLYDNIILIVWSSLIFMLFNGRSKELSTPVESFCNNSFGVFMLHEFFLEGFGLTQRFVEPMQSAALLISLVLFCWVLTVLVKIVISRLPYPFSRVLDY